MTNSPRMFFSLPVGFGRVFFAHHDLCDAVAIAEVDKRKDAEVALLRHPAHQHDVLADIALAKLTASVRPL
jgi:hypothetical protein